MEGWLDTEAVYIWRQTAKPSTKICKGRFAATTELTILNKLSDLGSDMKGLSLVIAGLFAMTAIADELTIAVTDANQGALDYQNEAFTGSLATLYSCPIEQLGQPYTVVTLPQTRALRMLQYNQIDLVMPLARTGTRDRYALFAKPLFEIVFELFTLPEQVAWASETTINIKIAAVWSSAVLPLIAERGHDAIPVDHHEIGVAMVKRGRAHGVLIPTPMVASLSSSLNNLTAQQYTTLVGGIYVDRGQPELLNLVNEAIATCSRD
jgi:hypothetical protein